MRTFPHNPHPVDLSDFFMGKNVVIGGRDYLREERDAEEFEEVQRTTQESSLHRLRRSVSEKLFHIDFRHLTF